MAGIDWGGTQFQALEITQPRSNLPTNHRMTRAYPGITYQVRVACVGGVYPYEYRLSNAPAGMTINPLSGLITWTNPTTTASNITVTVEDTKNNTVSATWSITVTTSGFKFVDAVNGSTSGTGAIGSPWRTLANVFAHSSGGDITYFREGGYDTTGLTKVPLQPGEGSYIDLPSSISQQWIAYPGETPTIDMGGQTNATGAHFYFDGTEIAWMEGIEFFNGFFKFFHNGGGSNGGGTFYRCEFHAFTSGASNTSTLMWGHSNGVYGIVLQDNYWHNEDNVGALGNGLAVLLYDNTRTLVEGNTFTDWGAPVSPKDAVQRFTVRGNTLTRMYYGLSSNMNDGVYTTSGEFSFNNFNGPFVSPEDIGAFELGPTWIGPVGVLLIQRNTFRGWVACAQFNYQNGPFTFSKNVIVNSDSTTTPYPYFREVSGFSPPDWGRVVDSNNLKGTEAAAIIDSAGRLTGTYRTSYLYTRGWEVPTTALPAPTFINATGITFTEGVAATFSVVASPSVTTITRTGSLPTGITFTDNGNGTATLAGTAASGMAGIYPLTFIATNASGSTAQTFSLVISAAAATTLVPIITIALQSQGIL